MTYAKTTTNDNVNTFNLVGGYVAIYRFSFYTYKQ